MGLYTDQITKKPTAKPQQRRSKPRIPPKVISNPTPASKPTGQTTVRANDRTDDYNRVKMRYAFEFFADQIARIKQLKKTAIINDRPFAMSDWVRKAIDKALEEVDRTGERPNER